MEAFQGQKEVIVAPQKHLLCSRLTGDDAEASEAERTHTGGGCRTGDVHHGCPTVADTKTNKVGRGSDAGMEEAPLKVEPEVAVDPKGTTANQSMTQPSLEA